MKSSKTLSFAVAATVLTALTACQKEANQKANPNSQTIGVTKHTYSYVDTVTPPHPQSSTKATDCITCAVPNPYAQLNYQGVTSPNTLGTYYIVAYGDKSGDSFNTTYSLYTLSGTPVPFPGYPLTGTPNAYAINQTAQGFGFTITPAIGSYNVNEYITQNGSGSTWYAPFTIYAEPMPPSGLLAFYRYLHNINGDHFYTSDWQEIASGGNGYHFEKVQGYLYPNSTAAPNLAPLYRFYNKSTGDHIYTVGTTELGGNSAFTNEGITGYISTVSQGNFTTPLYRYFNGKFHFFCSPPEDPTSSGYTNFEGTVGYVQAPQ